MAATPAPNARRSISPRTALPGILAVLTALIFLVPSGALGQSSAPLHPTERSISDAANVAPSPAPAPSSALPASLPIGQAAGSVAATLAPWADYAATGYHKLSAEPQVFGPAAFDPATGDLWIAQSNPTWYQAPAEVLEINATTLAPAGIVHGINNASGVAYDPASTDMYVADPGTGTVYVLNARTQAPVVPPIPVGPDPVNLSLDAATSRLFVANAGNDSVTTIDTTTNLVVKWSGNLGGVPRAIAADPSDLDVVVSLTHGLVWLSEPTLANVSFDGVITPAGALAIDQSGHAYLSETSGNFYVYGPAGYIGSGYLGTGGASNAAVFDPGLQAVFFTDEGSDTISAVATVGLAVSTFPGVGSSPTDLVWLPGTHQLDVLNSAVLYPGFFQGAYLYGPNSLGRTVMAVDDLTGAVNATSENLAASPSSLLYDPDGGQVVVSDIYNDNLSFVPATNPVGGHPFQVYVNGTPGQMAYDPLTHTIWVPMLTSPCGGGCYYPGGDIFVLNASTGSLVTLLYPDGHSQYDAISQVIYDAQNRSMIVGIFWDDAPYISLISLNATTYAMGPQLTSAGFYTYASPPNIPQIAYDPVHQQLYVSSPGNDTVMIFNATTLQQEAVDNVGTQPTGIAYDSADGDVYVVNTGSYNLTIINGTSRAVVVAGVQLSGVPVYIGYDPDTELLYVGVQNGVGPFPINLETTLVVLDGSSLSAVWGPWPTIYVGWASVSPMDGIAFVPSNATGTPGQIWTANTWDGSVTVVSIPPTASLVASPSVFEQGAPVTLTGVVAGGTDGLSYTYSGLPAGCASVSAPSLTCVPSAPGPFTVKLTVTDGLGLSAAASATFTVTPGMAVTATVSASATDVGRTVWANASATGGSGTYTYAWTFGDGGSASVAHATHVYAKPGTYTVNVSVSDGTGAVRVWSTSVQVNPAPAVLILGAVSSLMVGAPLDLSAVASGGTAPLSSVAWSFGDTTSGSGNWVSHTYTATGEFRIYANVTDALGEAASAWTDINVTASAPLAVSLIAGANLTSPGAPVTFLASASGGTGPYAYAWELNGSVVSGATTWSYTLTPKGAANYTVSVTVTDAQEHTATAKVVLEVLPPKLNTVTTTVPGKTQYRNSTVNVTTPAALSLGNLAPYLASGLVVGLIVGLILGLILARSRKSTTPPPAPATKDESEGPAAEKAEEKGAEGDNPPPPPPAEPSDSPPS